MAADALGAGGSPSPIGRHRRGGICGNLCFRAILMTSCECFLQCLDALSDKMSVIERKY